ncbi:MAG TPA: hypothetical protein VHE61_00630 [Opitutaceae bacterium]|nr:hypothetical protein [Opitutaceae bacterium]
MPFHFRHFWQSLLATAAVAIAAKPPPLASLVASAAVVQSDGRPEAIARLTGPLRPGEPCVASAWVRLDAGQAPATFTLRTTDGSTVAATLESDRQAGHLRVVYTANAAIAPGEVAWTIVANRPDARFHVDQPSVYPLRTGLFNVSSPSAIHRLGVEGVRLIRTLASVREGLAAIDHPAEWTVDRSGDRPVLRQSSPYLGSLRRTGDPQWHNYRVEVDVRLDSDGPRSAVLLQVCTQPDASAGEIRITRSGIRVVALAAGGEQELAQADGPTAPGMFHHYELTVADGRLHLLRDGKRLLRVVHPVFTRGAIALGTRLCAASFADLRVSALADRSTLFADRFDHPDASGWTVSTDTPFADIRAAARAGVPVVLTVTTHDPGQGPEHKWTLMPTASTQPSAADDLAVIRRFVSRYGQDISVYSVENEPNFEYTPADRTVTGGTAPALEWMMSIAATVHAAIAAHPGRLGHLRVAGPSLDKLISVATDPAYRSSLPGRFFQAQLDWENSDPNIDLIDFHGHEASAADLEACLAYLEPRAGKPLICTEWSEAHANAEWIKSPVNAAFLAGSAFARDPSVRTNLDYVRACYAHPVAKSEWDRFVAGSRLTPGFLQAAVDRLNRHGVILNTYGAMVQYGSPLYDLKQLYATRTVVLTPDGQYQANGNYPEQYRALRRRLPPR